MKKPILLLAAAASVAAIGLSQPANACADGGCSNYWSLMRDFYDSCYDIVAINPDNDTRTNIMLFMLDRDGDKSIPAQTKSSDGYSYDDDSPPFLDWTRLSKAFKNPKSTAQDAPYNRGDGTICQSNTAANAAFIAAVQANKKISEAERSNLIAVRSDWQPYCSYYGSTAKGEDAEKAALNDLSAITSVSGKEFASYLHAADAFYTTKFGDAAEQFTALTKADDKWVRETALYMVARSELNRAQTSGYDKYGDLDIAKSDKTAAKVAEDALNAYLKAYPKGRYADSAAGLVRRTWWIAGEDQKLADAYQAAFSKNKPMNGQQDMAELVEEIDIKLPAEKVTDPLLLAMLDLKKMRGGSQWEESKQSLSRAELDGQRSLFASDTALFDFLRASHALHVANNPKEVLTLIPDAAKQKKFTYLQFSRQMLRGQALEATKDVNARGFWLEMFPGTEPVYQRPLIELAIALHDEQHRQASRVFEANSVVKNPNIRAIVLREIAGPELLRQQANNQNVPYKEREIALSTLLKKNISYGNYREFLRDLPLVNMVTAKKPPETEDPNNYGRAHDRFAIYDAGPTTEGYACPAFKKTVTQLAINPKLVNAQLCYAEFIRNNNLDMNDYYWKPTAPSLGSSPSEFPGKALDRLTVYRRVIADKNAAGDDKAYALYRAVYCFARSGNNGCSTEEVPVSQRKAWFQQLKRDYPKSHWAADLKYYW